MSSNTIIYENRDSIGRTNIDHRPGLYDKSSCRMTRSSDDPCGNSLAIPDDNTEKLSSEIRLIPVPFCSGKLKFKNSGPCLLNLSNNFAGGVPGPKTCDDVMHPDLPRIA